MDIRLNKHVSTHPDIAALVTPLSASRIEGRKRTKTFGSKSKDRTKRSLFLTPKILLPLFPPQAKRGWSGEA